MEERKETKEKSNDKVPFDPTPNDHFGIKNNFLAEANAKIHANNQPELMVEKPEFIQGRESDVKLLEGHAEIKQGEQFFELTSNKLMIERFLDSKAFQIVINLLTIYALFADDFRTAFLPKSADDGIDSVTVVCMIFFTIEIVLSVASKDKYLFSFFFWLDIISTISLIFDLKWFVNAVLVDPYAIFERAGRLIRLVRLVKLYKAFKNKRKPALSKSSTIIPMKTMNRGANIKPQSVSTTSPNNYQAIGKDLKVRNLTNCKVQEQSTKDRFSNDVDEDEEDGAYDPNKESRVGKKLSDLTTKRVIILVLVLVVFTPFFSADYWFDPVQSFEIGLKELTAFEQKNTTTFNASFDKLLNVYWDYNTGLDRYPIVSFLYPARNISKTSGISVDDLRKDEQKAMLIDVAPGSSMTATVDYRTNTKTGAIINIIRTIYISIILTFGAYLFSKDADKLALRPIERMIEKVNRIAKNPLSSKDESMISSKDQQQYETTIIENAIIKIGTLLALGFGDAGSEIIAQNISQGGDVNPMIPGKKTYAIFGFCDIRNFTDSTEVLQEDVMVFVNVIGRYVHKIVDKYGGAANKNIGDAFLLVWRAEEGKEGKVSRKLKNISDLSLISFLKIISAINRKKDLLEYRENEKLNERIPNYKVKMGFGLHIGWAIEGAIGSIYKIDASYLSPNVNMAARLEAATKQYGVPLLISGDLHTKFSKKVKNMCREIDRVTVKGSVRPVSLFTFDTDISKLPPSDFKDFTKKEQAYNHKLAKKRIQLSFIEGQEKANSLFSADEDLERLSILCNSPLNTLFKSGYESYIKGDWPACKHKLEECLNISPIDGPTNALYQVLKSSQFMAPNTWKGYRELTEK